MRIAACLEDVPRAPIQGRSANQLPFVARPPQLLFCLTYFGEYRQPPRLALWHTKLIGWFLSPLGPEIIICRRIAIHKTEDDKSLSYFLCIGWRTFRQEGVLETSYSKQKSNRATDSAKRNPSLLNRQRIGAV